MHWLRIMALVVAVVTLSIAQQYHSPDTWTTLYDQDGKPLAGASVFTYKAHTGILLPTYVDSKCLIFNPNPVMLDYRGMAQIHLRPGLRYKVAVYKKGETHIQWMVDGVTRLEWGTPELWKVVNLTQGRKSK